MIPYCTDSQFDFDKASENQTLEWENFKQAMMNRF